MRCLLSHPDYEPGPGNAAANRAHVALVSRRMAAPVNEWLLLRYRKHSLSLVALDPVTSGEVDGAGVSGLGDLRQE